MLEYSSNSENSQHFRSTIESGIPSKAAQDEPISRRARSGFRGVLFRTPQEDTTSATQKSAVLSGPSQKKSWSHSFILSNTRVHSASSSPPVKRFSSRPASRP